MLTTLPIARLRARNGDDQSNVLKMVQNAIIFRVELQLHKF